MEYKNTLNLPRTDFSMKANLTALEPKIIAHWDNLDIYSRLRKERKKSQKFILHDGPPYANGLIHLGHALNKILKDIIVKYKILRGYDAPFVVGWDCHGLPVEHQLFKELQQTKHDVQIAEFRKKAKEYASKFVGLQSADFKRLGVFSDWNKPYLTLDPEYEYEVVKLLGYLTEQGYIYRGLKPVNWCSKCETALAEAEVEYLDKDSHSIYFLFDLVDDKNVFKEFGGKKISFLIWTTTPWTLVSNVAVAVHPEFEYIVAEFQDKLLVLAKDLIPLLEEKLKVKLKIFNAFFGRDLEHIQLQHPFLNRQSKVVLADFVSKEEGSGCVHIAPGHGAEDYSLTKKYKLDIIMPVDEKGNFKEPLEFKGKGIEEANKVIIRKLRDNKHLIEHKIITHSYPHCWRCKMPIIFRATFQWFLNVDHKNLRQNSLAAVEEVDWIPSSGKERITSMLTLRPDWCLSRQRLWGVPIPALRCKSCDKVILDPKVISKAADNFKKYGSDSWFNLELSEFIPHDFKCDNCNHKDFVKEFDILDVWFESGASFLAVVKHNEELLFPADIYLEGSDQHRGWFQASLIPSVAKEKVAPFKIIITHGFVVDGEGKKMSKSLGNVIAPQEISKRYGAEILRLWAAYADYSEDVKISEDIIKQLVDMYRKVRNTIRFILGNISDFDKTKVKIGFSDLTEVDRFMLARSTKIFKDISDCYDNFSFYKACQKIFNFCNLDMSSFYLDILKDRLYTFPQNSQQRRSGQFVLSYILRVLLKIIAPILPFTSEDAYFYWNIAEKDDSVFIAPLDEEINKKWVDSAFMAHWEKILELRSQVLKEIEKKRESGSIGSSLEAEVILEFNEKDLEFCSSQIDTLKEILIVSSVMVREGNNRIIIQKAKGSKCLRCWNWSETVNKNSDYPDICDKCIKALKEDKK